MEQTPFSFRNSFEVSCKRDLIFQAWGKEMTKEQFEEILHIQQMSTDVLTPGGFGQVLK